MFEQYQELPIEQKIPKKKLLKINQNKLEVDRDVLISNDHFLVHYIFQIIEKIFKNRNPKFNL